MLWANFSQLEPPLANGLSVPTPHSLRPVLLDYSLASFALGACISEVRETLIALAPRCDVMAANFAII